jgi:Rieske 2Fe-2S family protein
MTALDSVRGELELVGPPAECFTSREWYERDLEVLFRSRWQLAAHASELPTSGAFLRFTSGPDEAVIVRGDDGEINAYRNYCRHRGHRLCTSDAGKAGKRLVCPYHGWSYSLDDGSLQTAPKMHERFERGPWSLRRAWVEQHRGLIFVNFGAQRPAALADVLASSHPELAADAPRDESDVLGGYDFDRMKVGARSSWEVEANWKLLVENNLECYHCQMNHPELCRVLDPWSLPARYGSDGEPLSTDQIREIAGREIRRSGDFDNRYSFDGASVCSVALPRLRDTPGPTFFLHIAPYNVIAPTADYVWTWAIDPCGPTRSRVRHLFLVHEEARSGVDFDPATLSAFWNTVMAQDEPLCSELQRGVSQPGYTPGPLNRDHQMFVAGFYEWYRDAHRP